MPNQVVCSRPRPIEATSGSSALQISIDDGASAAAISRQRPATSSSSP
jgi:hypothetical protein